MELHEVDRLLNPEPLHLEMGIERLSNGTLHVASRTLMVSCRGEMFDWWFRFFDNSQQYAWWHPGDHEYLKWDDSWKPGGPYTNRTCVVDEKLGGEESYRLHIHFIEPTEIFSEAALKQAYADGTAEGVVTAVFGIGSNPPIADGRPRGGRLIHVPRNTPYGCVLRSHFFLGQDLVDQMTPEEVTAVVPDEIGLGLVKHANSEFTFLSKFLPSLYIAENRATKPVPLPW